MRRLLVAVAMLICLAELARAQVLCVDGGYAYSNQYGSQLNLLPEGKGSFAGVISIEYLRMPHFCLRSGLGYLGFGPKVDFVLGDLRFKESLFADYTVARALLGLRYEVGVDFWMARDMVKLGLLCCYENDVSRFAKSAGNRLYNQSYSVQLSFGFRLGGGGASRVSFGGGEQGEE